MQLLAGVRTCETDFGIEDESQQNPNVCFWHKADMLNALANVRFWGPRGQ
jgi:hypothetical protein